MKEPEKVNIVIFRENTEDVYAGIEWKAGSPEAEKLRRVCSNASSARTSAPALGDRHQADVGVRLQAPDRDGASDYAITNDRPSVTLVHKGNIMKFTEGAFRDWGYEVARESSATRSCTEADLAEGGKPRAPTRSSSRTASPTRCSSRSCCAPTSTP